MLLYGIKFPNPEVIIKISFQSKGEKDKIPTVLKINVRVALASNTEV